jgi:hypothetical protein
VQGRMGEAEVQLIELNDLPASLRRAAILISRPAPLVAKLTAGGCHRRCLPVLRFGIGTVGRGQLSLVPMYRGLTDSQASHPLGVIRLGVRHLYDQPRITTPHRNPEPTQ